MNQPPRVHITSPNGVGFSSTVEVDGVSIPCSRVTWQADADGVAHAELEIPRVGLDAHVREVVARYVNHQPGMPLFWWQCPCGTEMAHTTIAAAAEAFTDPSNHLVGCDYVGATDEPKPSDTGDRS